MIAIQKNRIMDFLSVISLILIIALFTAINPNFIGPINIKNILFDSAPLLAVAIGVTFVLLIGSVDLSVGAVCSCACVFTGLGLPYFGNSVILMVLLFGLGAGLLNGLLFTKLKIPSFIVTLCTMNIWNCVALIVSKGRPAGIPIEKWGSIRWAKISFSIIPFLFLLALAVLGIFYIIQSKTRLGKAIYAVGANQRAAGMVGIDIPKTTVFPFVFTGFGAALSGVFYALILKSSLPTIGNPLTLTAMAAVALGGTPLTGGRGNVLRTLLGVFLVVVIQNGLNVVAVDAFWQQIVFGAVVIFSVYLNSDKKSRNLIVK